MYNMDMDLGSVQGSLTGIVPEQFADFAGFPIILIATLILGLMAIYSYKIFRITLTLGGAIVCGLVGSSLVAPIVVGLLGEGAPLGIEMEYAIGFIFALIGGVTMNFFFKVALFISGAGAGWMVGSTIVTSIVRSILPTVEFLNTSIGEYVINGVCAIIVGVLSLFLFKFIYIVFTSLGGMIGASLLIVTSIKPEAGNAATMVAIAIGFIAGIIAAVNQYKSSDKNHNNANHASHE